MSSQEKRSFRLALFSETDRAYKVGLAHDDRNPVFLPKSLCVALAATPVFSKHREIILNMPVWLAEKEGLENNVIETERDNYNVIEE